MSINPVAECARKYLGTPWKHQGRSKDGIDCAGLIIIVARDLGYVVPTFNISSYTRRTIGHNFLEQFQKNLNQVRFEDIREGLVVVTRDHQFPCHCGIIGKDRRGVYTLIHAVMKKRLLSEDIYSKEWRDKSVALFEYRT